MQVERIVLYIRRYFAMAAVRRVLMHHLCTSHSLICMHFLEVGVCVSVLVVGNASMIDLLLYAITVCKIAVNLA